MFLCCSDKVRLKTGMKLSEEVFRNRCCWSLELVYLLLVPSLSRYILSNFILRASPFLSQFHKEITTMAPVSHLLFQTEPSSTWSTDPLLEQSHNVGSCLLHYSIIAFIAMLFLSLSVLIIQSLFKKDETEDEDFENFIDQQDHSLNRMETLLVTIEEYDTFIGQQEYFLDEKTFSRVTVDEV